LRSACRVREGNSLRSNKALFSTSLDHGTVNRCNYYRAPIAKPHTSSTDQVAFAWYFVENIFSKRCTLWSARDCRHIFPQCICEWTVCALKMVRESMTRKIVVWCHGSKNLFLWYSFLFEQINHIQTAVCGHPQLSLQCRLQNRISFEVFDRYFCKVETRAC